MNPSTQNKLIIPAVIVLVALILVGAVYCFRTYSNVSPFEKSGDTYTETIDGQTYQMQDYVPTYGQKGIRTSSTATSTAASMAGWKTYTNSQYGFSFQYPTTYQAQNPDSNLMSLPSKTNVVELHGSPDNILVTYASGSTLDESSGKYGTDKIYFDTTKNQWMRTTVVSIGDGRQHTETTVITLSYGNGGLAYFSDDTGISVSTIIPLSHNSFVIMGIADNSPGDESVLSNIAATFTITN